MQSQDEKRVLDTYEGLAREVISKGYRHNPIYMARKAIVDWDLMMQAGIHNKRVLNVGCFEPIDEIIWAGLVKEWVAIDLSPTSIEVARQIVGAQLPLRLVNKIKFRVMNAQKLDFRDERFDVVLSFSVIDHIPDPEIRYRAIHEMARVVKANGYVVLTVPNRYGYFHIMHNRNVRRGIETHVGYQYFYSYFELKSVLTAAGLTPIRFTSDMKNINDLPKWIRALLMPFIFLGDRMGFLAQKCD
jgi:SAM-dependent methyltransferase